MVGATPVLVSLLLGTLVVTTGAISCTSQLQNLKCLPVFTHTPASLPKCYCTSQCPDVETLRDTCFSGQLQTDPCGICLQCAPGVRRNISIELLFPNTLFSLVISVE